LESHAWLIVRSCPDVTFQILTKRPELIAARLPADWGEGYPNVWLGVSVENPAFYWRLDEVSRIPAALRFVSAEPLLKPIDLTPWLIDQRIGWVIVGGESMGRPGHPPRLTHPDWVRGVRDQCVAEEVPFLFKQRGGTRKADDGAYGSRQLDGRTWDGMPTIREAVTA